MSKATFKFVRLAAAVSVLAASLTVTAPRAAASGSDNRVEFTLNDEPGRWFRSDRGAIAGTQSLAVATPGVEVRFKGGSHTVHTMTSLSFPAGAKGMPFDTEATK